MKQPISTITNAAYPIAGFLAGVSTLTEWYATLMLTILAIASAGYHATDRYDWQKADEIGMYAALWALIALQLTRLQVDAVQHLSVAGVSGIITGIMGISHKRLSSFNTLFVLFCMAWLTFFMNKGWVAALTVLAIFGASYALRQVGVNQAAAWRVGHRASKAEDAWHGIWHIGTAAGFYLMLL